MHAGDDTSDEAPPRYPLLHPPHSDRGQLLHPLRGQRRGPAALVPDPRPEPELPLLLVLAAAAALIAADGDPFDVLPRHAKVPLTLVELLGGRVVHRPLVGLRTARRRLLVLVGGLDPEDLLAQPLLHGRELVPAVPGRLHPPPEILALAYDVARLGG